MIHDLKSYPAMKDSGLPWVGEVPEHWSLSPNRLLMRRRKVLVGQRHTEYRLLSLTKEGVIVRDVESGKGKFSADVGTSQEVRNGDLVFCLFDVPETPRTVGLSHHDGMITGAYTVFECSDSMLSAFLDLYYRAMDDRKLLGPLYSGLRNTIPPTRLLGTKTPVPPPTEQASIVQFLGHADRRIRRYIRAKQKLIKLLEEQKQAIIHRAVTRGFDPNVCLKPSGVEWLGDVPEHWEVRRIKTLFREKEDRSGDGRGVLLSLTRSHGIVPQAEVSSRMASAEDLSKYKQCRSGDLVMNRMQAWSGMFALSLYDGLVSPDYSVFCGINSMEVKYFEHLFKTPKFVDQFAQRSKGIGSGFNRLYTPEFGAIHALVPPIHEQSAIVRFLNEATANIVSTIDHAKREISLLREYRIRLIADVVTGKLDVSGVAASLPIETDDLEALDDGDAVAAGDKDSAEGDLDVSPEEAEA